MQPPLRVLIIADGLERLERWEERLFDRIMSDRRFELAGILLDQRQEPLQLASCGATPAAALILRWAGALERRLTRPGPAGESGTFRASRERVPVVRGPPEGQEVEHVLKDLEIDVVLHHARAHPASEVFSGARLGVWRLDHAGGRSEHCRGLSLREALERRPVTIATLRRLEPDGRSSTVIARAAFTASPLAERNRATSGENAVALVWRELCRLARQRSLGSMAGVPVEAEEDDRALGVAESLRYGSRVLAAVPAAAANRLFRRLGRRENMWSLFFGRGELSEASLASTREAPPRPGEFWADPFLVRRGGRLYVFFENYVYATGRAKITVGIYGESGLDILGDALDRPYHLSFPFVLEANGETYLVPESSSARRVEVWRAVEFPLRWELHATALEGTSVADTVLFEDGGAWWMFANISEGPVEDHCNALHVFSIDGPSLERITPHPMNPVVIDSRTGRNAGRIARRRGRLVRASQNNSYGVYGRGLNLMEITRLDMEGYEERLLQTFGPAFRTGLIGCHHVDFAGEHFVVDGCRRWG